MAIIPALIVFDVDGTLYEEPAVYERFARELARFVPDDRRARFLAESQQARDGALPVRVGLGYDTRTDTLFRHADGRIVARFDWQGDPLPEEQTAVGHVLEGRDAAEAAHQPPGAPPIETSLFGEDLLNIGDLWGLSDAIAAHYGVARSERSAAFLATRAAMDAPAFALRAAPGLDETLRRLRGRGIRLVAMTNSPAETTRAALEKLGIRNLFDALRTEARKPRGLREFLAAQETPEAILVIGDNYINEAEPALQAGAAALFIDRFATGFGAGHPHCAHAPSIPAMLAWLRDSIRNEPSAP